MIVQMVFVIVTAVQVNSQELCPSVCVCYSEQATCTDLFSDVTDMMQHRFPAALRVLRVYGTTNLELQEDRFLRWDITSLTYLDLSQNNITKIWQRAFHSLLFLENLYLYGNSMTTLHNQTFYYNIKLATLSLAKNCITDIHPSTFQNNIRLRDLDLSGNKLFSIHQNIFYNNVNLVWLDLGSNRINYTHPSTFGKASRLTDLNISRNKITAIHPETFSANVELQWLNLNDNNITDIHPSTFRKNSMLSGLHISGNKLASITSGTFDHNRELQWLNLERNSITDIHPSTFRNNGRLRHLDISRNKITLINPGTFIHNKELTFLYLQGNIISDISTSSFRGLEQLEEMDLSNNNIEQLDPLVFQNTLTSTNRQNHRVSKLKHINLAQNKIRSFNFELYFPMNSNSVTSTPTFQLEYLNISSNRLTTLDLTSAKWLNHTTAVTDPTANPWNCDCSVLLEAWRELKDKLTLLCASPRQLQGKSWDVIEVFCSKPAEDMNYKSNRDSEVVSPNTEHEEESDVSTKDGGLSVPTTALIVIGVLLVCAFVGGFLLAKVMKRLRNRSKTREHWDVYAPRASYVSNQSYADVGSEPSHVSVESYADVSLGPPRVSLQSYADVGSRKSNATAYAYVAVQ